MSSVVREGQFGQIISSDHDSSIFLKYFQCQLVEWRTIRPHLKFRRPEASERNVARFGRIQCRVLQSDDLSEMKSACVGTASALGASLLVNQVSDFNETSLCFRFQSFLKFPNIIIINALLSSRSTSTADRPLLSNIMRVEVVPEFSTSQ